MRYGRKLTSSFFLSVAWTSMSVSTPKPCFPNASIVAAIAARKRKVDDLREVVGLGHAQGATVKASTIPAA